MTTSMTTIRIEARQHEDHDDCLAAAAKAYASKHALEGWDLEARWEDDQRDFILLTVPSAISIPVRLRAAESEGRLDTEVTLDIQTGEVTVPAEVRERLDHGDQSIAKAASDDVLAAANGVLAVRHRMHARAEKQNPLDSDPQRARIVD